tara:strand:+ start:545 stop:904 length:360 start_codon:yes stop_codon:yes gene_type:complete
MTQKELLESVLQEIKYIKKSMPNGEMKALVDDVQEMKEDMTELKYQLLNPDNGVIVKTNLNTNFRRKLEEGDKDFQERLREIEELRKWKDGVNKALWIIFAALAGIIIKLIVGLDIEIK